MRHVRFTVMTFVVAFFALTSAAMAQSYTGDWPATVTGSQRDNGVNCISLTDNGSFGAKHSGTAVLNGQPNPYGGYFTVVNGIITVVFTYPSGEGDCCSYQVFTAKAANGQIGNGVFNYLGITDIGLLSFGEKNGCTSKD
jgi:autotransporter-associated beta strand protein